ncbi:MAG TPA: OadG family protein [Salinivirga sp.]|uniref:OadG family protein n=1 Tax=Salinivirga sp. TaxID=1970192 RepID=UPI002B4927ED|nr:OadG family protein [Salinivirga sp.]HKK60082.1 OadG family protein [Salinivirga sp.]
MMNIIASVASQGGYTVALVGIVVVFAALVLLYLVFSQLPRIINMNIRSQLRREGKYECADQDDFSVPGDESAAIAAAVHLYYSEMHDEESNIITIKNMSRKYSPWSSKIYGVQNQPVKLKF